MRTGIFIGRFQPVHQGHIHAIGVAASQVQKLYILVGSANQCRSIKNPWTFEERKQMLHLKMHSAGIYNYEVVPLNDYRYSDTQWMSDVRATIEHFDMKDPILFGHMKEGNDYLKWFPELKFKSIESQYTLNATQIRQKMFEENSIEIETVSKLVSKPLKEKLKNDATELNFLKKTTRAKLVL